jgi:hypothetical protein
MDRSHLNLCHCRRSTYLLPYHPHTCSFIFSQRASHGSGSRVAFLREPQMLTLIAPGPFGAYAGGIANRRTERRGETLAPKVQANIAPGAVRPLRHHENHRLRMPAFTRDDFRNRWYAFNVRSRVRRGS